MITSTMGHPAARSYKHLMQPARGRATSAEGVRGDSLHLGHGVSRDPGTAGGGDDRVRAGGLIQAIRPVPVGAQEREQPADALVGVDLLYQPYILARHIELLREPALDEIERHGGMLPPLHGLHPPISMGGAPPLGPVGGPRLSQ